MQDNTFENIYRTGFWKNIYGSESGPGSSIECSKPYLDFLQQFCATNNIKSILDLGCGDFNLMQHFDFDGMVYHGVDVVDFVIQQNCAKYSTSNITFETASIVEYTPKQSYDLILCKDVLQHLPQNDVKVILNQLQQYTALVTNDYDDYQNSGINLSIEAGKHTIIDLQAPPYCVAANCVFEWMACWSKKRVYQIIHV